MSPQHGARSQWTYKIRLVIRLISVKRVKLTWHSIASVACSEANRQPLRGLVTLDHDAVMDQRQLGCVPLQL